VLRNNSWTPNFHSIKNPQTKCSLPHQKQAYGSSTSCCRSPFITVIFNRVQTSKRVANSPTRGRGSLERAHTMLRGRHWKKSQQRKKSVRAAMGRIKKKGGTTWIILPLGIHFLLSWEYLIVKLPAMGCGESLLHSYHRLPKHGPVQTTNKCVMSSSGVELVLCGYIKTKCQCGLATRCHVCVQHYASGFRTYHMRNWL
jgi:hypothetical protein